MKNRWVSNSLILLFLCSCASHRKVEQQKQTEHTAAELSKNSVKISDSYTAGIFTDKSLSSFSEMEETQERRPDGTVINKRRYTTKTEQTNKKEEVKQQVKTKDKNDVKAKVKTKTKVAAKKTDKWQISLVWLIPIGLAIAAIAIIIKKIKKPFFLRAFFISNLNTFN